MIQKKIFWKRAIKRPIIVEYYQVEQRTEVETWHGSVVAEKGDYITKDEEGKDYPVKRSILHKTYSSAAYSNEIFSCCNSADR